VTTPWREIRAEATLLRALRLVSREVRLREAARSLELVPARWDDAERLFAMATRLREERLELLRAAGVLEMPIDR
jgi:hypothetical protein